MEIAYILPSPALAPYISVHCEMSGFGETRTETIPSLLGQVHIRLAGEAKCHFADGRSFPMPRVSIWGATNSAFRIEMSADYHFHCIGLLAVGWSQVITVPAHELADQVLDAELLWPAAEIDALVDRLCATRSMAERMPIIDTWALQAISLSRASFDRRAFGVDRWLESSGGLCLDALAKRLDISHRQVRRLTQSLHGASPKLLAMKYRALRAAADIAVHGAGRLDDAVTGYADQAHMIRDFRRFVGWTPQRYLDERQHIARLTMAGRWQAGARRALALWS